MAEPSPDMLSHCEREQLHLSSAIQPGGALVVTDALGQVTHVSVNIGDVLPRGTPEDWLGQHLPACMWSLAHNLRAEPGSRLRAQLCADCTDCADARVEVTLSRAPDGAIAWECLPATPDPSPRAEAEGEAVTACHIDTLADVERASAALVRAISVITGAHRVMFLRFDGSGDGEVTAEAVARGEEGSYLGLRFPASDVPQIARALHTRNPWRLIQDAQAPSLDVVGLGHRAPDLTYVDLRSVSPVHALYLANMGVRTSLSFPVMMGTQLHALISVHHREPLPLDRDRLEQASGLTRRHGLALTRFNAQRRMRLIDNLARDFAGFRNVLRGQPDPQAAWPELGQWLMAEFSADGAVFCTEQACVAAGLGLEPDALYVLDQWFARTQKDIIWIGDSLSRQVPGFPLSACAGIIAVQVARPGKPRQSVYLTRAQHIHEVAWGGQPNKPVEHAQGGLLLAPRRSFEKWVETRLGYCRPWTNEERLRSLKLREMLQTELC